MSKKLTLHLYEDYYNDPFYWPLKEKMKAQDGFDLLSEALKYCQENCLIDATWISQDDETDFMISISMQEVADEYLAGEKWEDLDFI